MIGFVRAVGAERRAAQRSARFDELLLAAAEWYVDEAGEQVALRLVDAVEVAVRSASARPELGSSYPAEVARVPGLRSWAVEGFPHLVYYTFDDRSVFLWVVLHGHRDLPVALRESQQE